MGLLARALMLFCVLEVAVSQRADRTSIRHLLIGDSDERQECDYDCTLEMKRTVCGSDGRTYNSRCEMQRARCQTGRTIDVQHRGKCKDVGRCHRERSHAQELDRRPMVGIFIPECNEDGSYAEVQCHTSTGYCWCVTREGKPVPNSSVRYQTPTCSGMGQGTFEEFKEPRQGRDGRQRRPTGGRKQSKEQTVPVSPSGCGSEERGEFNDNLIDYFETEYNRLPTPLPGASTLDILPFPTQQAPLTLDSSSSKERRVLDWKFSQLDSDNDGELDRKELKLLRRVVKKAVRPRTCARTFTKYCDMDKSKKVSKKEWSVCLGVQNIPFHLFLTLNAEEHTTAPTRDLQPAPQVIDPAGPTLSNKQINRQPTIGNRTAGALVKGGCELDRQKALDDQRRSPPGTGLYIPECNSDGSYKSEQCHKDTGYCWCVVRSTGRPIPGTSTQYSMPDCEGAEGMMVKPDVSDPVSVERKPVTPLPPREFKECPGAAKDRFNTVLLDALSTDMVEAAPDTTGRIPEPDPTHSLEERVVRWYFSVLDKNSNGEVNKREIKVLRQYVRNKTRPKKCSRNFIDYCDANQDQILTLDEFLRCTIEKDNTNSTSNPASAIPGRRRGPNPFSEYGQWTFSQLAG
ncbi:PREDICTED: SPARC-related modular calcium-binding protein 1-like isoform X4 [Branchiostoma belcheri]|uniref:SPARC-related modular calcium-binding protein 1-like isoform X4 n=1 Tax=Branchiostoma belcheri TaxID=7741 RepID=A0A6P4Z4P3_BRABE|nr:PREDICTED: SPARC-related modular calcium-binding protein 1-like isoform X4 [Branchiostoma belcheri]